MPQSSAYENVLFHCDQMMHQAIIALLSGNNKSIKDAAPVCMSSLPFDNLPLSQLISTIDW